MSVTGKKANDLASTEIIGLFAGDGHLPASSFPRGKPIFYPTVIVVNKGISVSIRVVIIGLSLLLAACQRPPYQDGEYATGQTRGDGEREKLLRNSAFEDPDTDPDLPQWGNVSSDGEFGLTDPNAPASDIPLRHVCQGSSPSGIDVLRAIDGLVVSLHPIDEGDNKSVAFTDPTEGLRIREAILNTDTFPLPLANVPRGQYQMLVCDKHHAAACADPLSGTVASIESAPPGVLAMANIDVDRGRLQGLLGGQNRADVLVNSRLSEASHNTQPCDSYASVLMVDTDNLGIDLLPPYGNSRFDIDGKGNMNFLSWPRRATSLFLFWDNNGDGRVSNGNELLDEDRLVELDGNGDRKLDSQDESFGQLRLWSDANGNGVSEAEELRNAKDLALQEIDLGFLSAEERDRWGNTTERRTTLKMAGSTRLVLEIRFRRID